MDTTMRVTPLATKKPAERPIMAIWCPGNGTRYELLFIRFGDAVSGAGQFGAVNPGSWLVVCSLTGRACLLQGHGFLYAGYVGAKLGLEGEDLDVVTEMIGRIVGRPWCPPTEEDTTEETPKTPEEGELTDDNDAA